MKKVLKVMKVICKVFLCVIFVMPVLIYTVNDKIASDAADDILSLPLPENTEFIEKKSAAGKLSGCGNGMQHFGVILIKSSLSEDELKSYYGNYSANDWTYVVEPQKGCRIEQIEHGNVFFTENVTGDDYYIVYSYGSSGNDFVDAVLDIDLRGH